jgi:hypothetical protein
MRARLMRFYGALFENIDGTVDPALKNRLLPEFRAAHDGYDRRDLYPRNADGEYIDISDAKAQAWFSRRWKTLRPRGASLTFFDVIQLHKLDPALLYFVIVIFNEYDLKNEKGEKTGERVCRTQISDPDTAIRVDNVGGVYREARNRIPSNEKKALSILGVRDDRDGHFDMLYPDHNWTTTG